MDGAGLINHHRIVFQREKAMCAAGGNEQHFAILRAQFMGKAARAYALRRRALIQNHVHYFSDRTIHKLVMRRRWSLKVHAS